MTRSNSCYSSLSHLKPYEKLAMTKYGHLSPSYCKSTTEIQRQVRMSASASASSFVGALEPVTLNQVPPVKMLRRAARNCLKIRCSN